MCAARMHVGMFLKLTSRIVVQGRENRWAPGTVMPIAGTTTNNKTKLLLVLLLLLPLRLLLLLGVRTTTTSRVVYRYC